MVGGEGEGMALDLLREVYGRPLSEPELLCVVEPYNRFHTRHCQGGCRVRRLGIVHAIQKKVTAVVYPALNRQMSATWYAMSENQHASMQW